MDPGEQVRFALEDQLGLMANSPTLKAAGAPVGELPAIIKNTELLKPADFEQRFFATAADRGLDLADSVATIDFALGFTVRGAVCLRLGSGGNLVSLHAAVHEAIHALAERGAVKGFGPVLNEGVTELLAQRVLEEVGPSSGQEKFWKPSGNPYATQRDRVAPARRDQGGQPRAAVPAQLQLPDGRSGGRQSGGRRSGPSSRSDVRGHRGEQGELGGRFAAGFGVVDDQ